MSVVRHPKPYVEPCTLYRKCPDRICDKNAILLWQNFPATPFGGREKKTGDNANFSHVLAPTNHPGMSCVRRISKNLKRARSEFRRNRWVKVSLNFWILGSQDSDSVIKPHRMPEGKSCLQGTLPLWAWGTSPGLWGGWAVPWVKWRRCLLTAEPGVPERIQLPGFKDWQSESSRWPGTTLFMPLSKAVIRQKSLSKTYNVYTTFWRPKFI